MFVRRVASDRMRSFGPALFVAIILACTSNPIAAQQAPGSDDFSGSSLDTTTWTATAPLGGAISVSNGHALLVVPGGNNHDAFVGGNNSVRMLQSVPNSDIDVVAKFDSVVSGQYQGQGILVQQDGITYLRFEVFSIDSQRMIYASYVGNGNQHTFFNNPVSVSAPVWLRVSRSGSAWTLRYSTNGTAYIIAGSFNQNVTVSTIGPYAWNYNNNPAAAPALTASVDYFHNLSTSNPPSISSVGRTVTQISATITWTTDQQATGQVNYGLTPSYGQSVANSILSTNHSILVTGLTCGQTYDFDVSSTSPNNQTAASGNFTFTTAGCIAGGGPASDNFDERALNTSLWTFVNPFADANLAMNGTAATINIPQGRTHDAYTSGNNAVRLTQAISNVNFEVVVRFQSAVELGNQDQGIMVVQDNTHFLRFDTYSDGTNTRLFAAVIQGNNAQTFSNAIIVLPNPAAPIWLKLLRTGNSWIGSWSTDGVNFNNGTNFSASLNVSSIGPYAGTYNSSPTLSPAFTSTVDYFLNTANPLPNQDGPPPLRSDHSGREPRSNTRRENSRGH
jgi:regulation of enolase protein 1 (concanavalin A-like superfamily)